MEHPVCVDYLLMTSHVFLQIAKQVLDLGDISACSTQALGDGLNFMSDAYFVKINGGEKDLNLFAKVCQD